VLQRSRQEQGSPTTYYAGDQVKNVVLACGIDIVREEENWIDIFCPYHHNVRTSSAGINKNHGTFNCFSCNTTASLEEFVMSVTGKSYFEAIRLVDLNKENFGVAEILSRQLKKEPEYKEFDPELIDRLNNSALSNVRAKDYLLGRGINRESVVRHKIGYSEKEDMITIPIHMPNGTCVGIVGRSIVGKVFKNSVGMPKGKTFFNIHNAKRHDGVFVVESSFDAIRIEQAEGHAIASLGANISNTQMSLLKKYFNKIFVIGDNDDAGKEMVKKILEKLPNAARCVMLPDEYKDVSEIKHETLQGYISKINNHTLVRI
jgi:DNA primase